MEFAASEGNRSPARRFSLALTAAAATLPSIALVGWIAGVPILTSYGGRFIPMAPSTAICFLLLALPLFLTLRPARAPAAGRSIHLATGLVAFYGLLVAAGWHTGLPINPDELLFKELGTLGAHQVGRMSPATGALFALAGLSLTAFVAGLSRRKAVKAWLSLSGLSGSTVLFVGAIFTLGYALGAPLLYESEVIPLALPTAMSFLLLGGALTAAAVLHNPASAGWYRTLRDMPIGTQLRLGLGVLLAFVLLLGTLASRKTDLLWNQTRTMYDHPVQVRRALGALEADILAMRGGMKDVALAETEQEVEAALQEIAVREADALRRLEILHTRYLGPRSDVIALHDEFVQWHAVREESIRLLRAGRTDEAVARIRPGGAGGAHAEAMFRHLRTVDSFARNKGDQLYQTARKQKEDLNRQLIAIAAVILVLSLIISHLLMKGIKDPLQHLTAAAEQFRQGKMDVRSRYASANEFGALSASFDAMADAVEAQIRIKEKAAQLADVMLREVEAPAFCREMLKALVEQTGSQMGAVYLLNPGKTEFELFESIGLSAEGRTSFSATAFDGEFGVALATGRMQRITQIPEDTRFTFAAASGTFKPREIITLPLLSGQEPSAVISLASIRGYRADEVRLVEEVLSTLTARMNGVLAFRQIQELAARLDSQNRELEIQASELAAHADELSHQNTELELQKNRLDETNRLKGAFLSNMSHELRTPLNAVIALSGVLSRRLAGTIPGEEYGYLDVIARNGRQLLTLINDILDLSRIEAGRVEIDLGRFSFAELVGEVVATFEVQAKDKGVALISRVAADLPPVTSDFEKCRHILQNLVGNALKFTESGSVEISVRAEGDELRVSVRDTGIGIAAEQVPYIFEEFRQADGSTSRKYGGTGLGLAIAKEYATLLQGDVTVESALGQGSTFTFKLPLAHPLADAEATVAEAPGPAASRPNAADGRGKRILLVEDSEPAVIQMTEILTARGYEVRVAPNGREALALVDQSPPDAVILDLMMPEMDGFQVLRAIRGTESAAGLPVLILTAKHVTREELSFLKGNNIYQLIQKGDVSKTELLTAVARMVGASREGPGPLPRAPAPAVRSGRPVVLVVEDNPDNRGTMRALLQDTCTVLEAADGRAGLEQARQHRPDLILLDIALPVMDGFEALAAIRGDETLRTTPVVAVTARAMKGDREEILARGFDGYLSKPIDETLLRNVLREALHADS